MRSFLVKIAYLFFLMEAALTAHAQPTRSLIDEISALSVKYGGVHLKGEKEIEWSYPYFVGAKNPRIERLNAWLRAESIRTLFPASQDEDIADRATKVRDSVLIGWLRDDKKMRTASAELAQINASQVFGKYFFFTMASAWTDSSYHLDLGSLVFDYATGSEVEMKSLFKPGSEEALNEILVDEIKRVLAASRRDYLNCVKRKGNSCVGAEIDVDVCVQNTDFKWGYLQIVDSRHMSVQYPYRQRVHLECGTEFGFDLKGRKVEQLLIEPGIFKRGRSFANPEKPDR